MRDSRLRSSMTASSASVAWMSAAPSRREAPWYVTRKSLSPTAPGGIATGSISRHQSITQSDFEKKRWPPMSMRLPL